MRVLLLALLLCLAPGIAMADQEKPKWKKINDCELRIEFEPKEAMLHFRAGVPSGDRCYVLPETAAAELRAALKQRAEVSSLKLLFLGRLEDYHWLAMRVARSAAADEKWDSQNGKLREGNLNAYVAGLLMRENLSPLADVLAEYGYRIVGASVEKVMVHEMGFAGMPSGKCPGDALVHLRITKSP